MKPGTKPTPLILRQIRGTPGHHPQPTDVPEPEPARPEAPEYLNDDAKKYWDELVDMLAGVGLMTSFDSKSMELFCEVYGRWRQATAEVADGGLIIRSKKTGHLMQNPYLKVANKAHDQLVRLLAEFGMTPSSRTRTKVEPGAQDAWNLQR